MELTVMTKAKFDALTKRIASIEEQVTALHTCNNQLAEIAFDENKFTDALLARCEEAAREAAKEEIDVDDIANDVANQIDLSEDVERAVENLGCITKDDLNDKIDNCIENYISDNNILDSDEVESAIDDYVRHNCDFVESDVTDDLRVEIEELQHELQTLKETIVLEVLQLIANKLTGKDTHNANNDRDNSLQISGTDTTSQGASMLNAPSGQ